MFWERDRRTLVFLGKRGVGKSTTLNDLFGLERPTDPAMECTTSPSVVRIRPGPGRTFRLVDMPGIAAGKDSDKKYEPYYRRWLKRADTVVWITQADVRAYKQDQLFFREYSRFVRRGTRLVLGLSKADTQIESVEDLGGPLHTEILQRKAADALAEIAPHTWLSPQDVCVVAYSAARSWNTEALREAILGADRRSRREAFLEKEETG